MGNVIRGIYRYTLSGMMIATKKLLGVAILICVTTILTVSAQSADYPQITPENANQVTLIKQLGYGSITDIAFSPDGEYFAIGTSAGVTLYDVHNITESPHFFEGGTGTVTFSPDSSVLATAGYLRDAATGDILYEFDGYSPRFSTDSNRLLYVSGQDIVMLNADTYEEISRQTVNTVIYEIHLSADDVTLALDVPGDIVLWSLETGAETVVLGWSDYPTIFSGKTVFSPDGTLLLHAGFDGYVLWDVATGAVFRFQDTWFNPDLTSASFSADGRQIAIGDANAGIRVVDTITGEYVSSFTHEDEVYNVAFNPDGSLLAASGMNGVVHIWDTTSGEEYAELTGFGGRASVLGFNDTDTVLSAASIGGAAWQWNVDSGEQIGVAQEYKFYVSHGTVPYPNTIELN